MGVASLILGLLSLFICWIPFVGLLAILMTIIGLILGIVDVKKKSKANEKKGVGIAGIIINVIALIIGVIIEVIMFAAVSLVYSGGQSMLNSINPDEFQSMFSNGFDVEQLETTANEMYDNLRTKYDM